MASKCTGMVIIGVAVRIWTGFLEYCRVVYFPMGTFAFLWGVECSTTTIFVCVKCQTGAFTGCYMSADMKCQFFGTVGVEISMTASNTAIIVVIRLLLECSVNWFNLHWKVISIDQTDIIVILPVCSIKSEFGQTNWGNTTCSMTFDFVTLKSSNQTMINAQVLSISILTTITSLTVSMCITMCSTPNSSGPSFWNLNRVNFMSI